VKSQDIGQQYDQIASWWNDRHITSKYGVAQVEKALAFAQPSGKALDVGCGSGGRFIRLLEARDFDITGLDASSEMIRLAQTNHPSSTFVQADIRNWETDTQFDFILAWDCLFHLPLNDQKSVLSKLCGILSVDGVMIHTFGDGVGEHTDTWHGQEFGYSSIGIAQNIDLLHENGLSILHLELDQFPETHVFAISKKA
jgi:2-polyprenyl-3-methyl-5-hydroxy-6-metoxy-1,4-benzoquinol methylase